MRLSDKTELTGDQPNLNTDIHRILCNILTLSSMTYLNIISVSLLISQSDISAQS